MYSCCTLAGATYLSSLTLDLSQSLCHPPHQQRSTISSQGHTFKIALCVYLLSCKQLTPPNVHKEDYCSYNDLIFNFLHSDRSYCSSKWTILSSICVCDEIDTSDLRSILCVPSPLLTGLSKWLLMTECSVAWLWKPYGPVKPRESSC